MVKKQKFYFRSSDKETKIHGICWIPDGKPVKGVLQIAHGMVEYIDRYDAFARYLCERGFVVVGNDHLGHGDSVKSPDDWGYFGDTKGFEHVLGDIHKIRRQFRKKYPDVPYFLMGHSMGSFMARAYLMQYGKGISGAIIMGTGHQPILAAQAGKLLTNILSVFKGWHFRSQLVNKMAFGSYNKKFQPSRTDFDWLTRDEAIVDSYIAEPRCQFVFTLNGYHELFRALIYIEKRKNIEKLPKDLPVLFVSGDKDPVGNFGKGVDIVCETWEEAGLSDVTLKLFEGGRHEILNEIDRNEVYEYLYQWLTDVAGYKA